MACVARQARVRMNCPSFFGASCYCVHFCVKMKTAQKDTVHVPSNSNILGDRMDK